MINKKLQIQKHKENEIKYRNINDTTIESLANRLAATSWEDTLGCKDCDQEYETFIEQYKFIYNQCFHCVTKVKPRNAPKPWITSDCLKDTKRLSLSTLYSYYKG